MRERPNPARWVWYALGGTLPERHREWVRHDLTSRTWALRHLARSTVLIAPLAAVWWLLPGSVGLHLALSLLACVVGYFYSFAYATEGADHRLVKHGFPPGTFAAVRAETTRETDELARARYDAMYRNG